ncbi:glyoxalase/bleomycin resistance/extradiol dioxygenase family protein [Streptomyces sp. Ru73]|uniref:VOC family protein n=1 Tax=Streptomyces sp. Ru73 TaxID=2080748 RepID=UPI000CDDBE09|nr:VOC family protein [Streptomyces sp. Ru73]POX36927.1 glyoxalase/bleomycin resistance/extradiol dioxygenase family protein [Streptomyces sp. Ru73]
MDALHPRLLTSRFAETFGFYDAVLPALLGATRTRGDQNGPYASWDVGDEGILALLDREALAGELRGGGEPRLGNSTMLVSRVPDVQAAFDLCTRHGATVAAQPADRPEWGPTMRTAHVRDPDGNLWELQSY